MRRQCVAICFVLSVASAGHVAAQGYLVPNASIPVVGSGPGAFGSYFRTSLQLSNVVNDVVPTRLVFHPAGQTASPDDPSFVVVLGPFETTSYADIVETMNQSGLGSLDIHVDLVDYLPTLVVRVYNDGGTNGTTGFTEPVVTSSNASETYSRSAVLIAPADLQKYRYNIGIRTFNCQIFTGPGCEVLYPDVQLTLLVRNASGVLVRTVTKHLPNDYFVQQTAEQFLEGPIGPNYSIFIYGGGISILYGATVDNTTQDSSTQFTRKIAPLP